MIFVLAGVAVLALILAARWLTGRRASQEAEAARTAYERPTAAAAPAALPEAALDEADDPDASGDQAQGRGGKLSLLGDLAAGIAHEINNPIAIMVEEAGWIEDLLQEEDSKDSPNREELLRAVKQIKTQGKRCKEITHNLLSFARKGSVKEEDVSLNDLLRDIVKSYDKRLQAGRVTIESRFAESLPRTRISPSEMQQVFVNLINNAIDALEARGGVIRITTVLAGDDIVAEVSDNGPGIPKENLERIFDPFFTTKPVGKGTGLGLSICYGFVEKAGGDIAVESELEHGTTFRVRIPVKGAAGQAARPRPESTEAPAGTPAGAPDGALRQAEGGAPTVVLIVDDEVPFVQALSRRLAKRNFEVLTAVSGEEALATLDRKRTLDVVLLDVKLPGMDGMTALREIKKARPLVEVILLSAHTTMESAIEGMKLGAFDYLLKPCDATQLSRRIERAKARKNRQEEKIMEARIKEITSRRV